MDLDVAIPLKICLNLDRREDRRRHASEMFRMHHLRVRRLAATDGQRCRRLRGWPSAAHRGCALSWRRALRIARREGWPAVLVFEDDIVFHDDFGTIVAALQVPDDWDMLYFGCLHIERPVRVNSGLVKVTRALDTHALAIREGCYSAAIRALRPPMVNGRCPGAAPADVLLADLQPRVTAYAALPNLVWQQRGYSDIGECDYCNYGDSGSQEYAAEQVAGV